MKKFILLCVALVMATAWNTVLADDEESALVQLEELVDSVANLDLSFTTSTAPGYYDADAVAAYQEVYEAASEAMYEDLTDEEYLAHVTALREALATVLAAINPLPAGYYFIISGAYFYEVGTGEDDFGVYTEVTKAMYDDQDGGLSWTTLNESSLYQMWQIEELESGNYSIQNVGTGWYIKGSTATNTQMPLSEEQEVEQYIIGLGDGSFAICSELVMESSSVTAWSYHTGNHDAGEAETGTVMIWQSTYTADARNIWYFQEITEEYIDSCIEAANTPQALLATLVDSINLAGLEFEVGTDYGCYPEELYDAYTDALAAAEAAADGLTDEEYNALAEALRTALANLVAGKIDYEGYFYIVSAADWSAGGGETKAMYEAEYGVGDYGEGGLWWATLDEENSYFIWYITPLDGGGYSVQNAATGNYIYGVSYTNTPATTTETFQATQYINRMSAGYCTFYGEYNYYSSGYWSYHTGSHDSGAASKGNIQVWQATGSESARNVWYFNAIEDEEILNSILLTQTTDLLIDLLDEAYDYAGIEALGVPGYPSEDASEAIYAAWESIATAYEALEDPTYEEVSALYTELQAAIDAFIEDISPKTDTWYYIVSASSTYGWTGRYMYSANEVEGEEGDLTYGYIKYGGTDTSGSVLDETLTDLNYQWRIVEVDDGEYALQNRATGLSIYDSNVGETASALYVSSLSNGIINITYVGDAAFTIWYAIAYTYYYRPTSTTDDYVAAYYFETSTTSDVDKSDAYWQFVPVDIEYSEENYVTLPVLNNNVSIQCRPFNIGTWGEGDDAITVNSMNSDFGDDIKFYAVKNITYDEENDETVVELTLKDTFEAGEPFVMQVGDYEDYDGYSAVSSSDTIPMMLPVPTDFTNTAGEANGLVGNFSLGYFPEEGLGYIDFDDYYLYFELTGESTYQYNYNSGYFTAAGLEELDGDTDLTLYFTGGSITAVESIKADAAQDADAASQAIYDLQGRQVAAPGKGIYIVGGKKVIYK